jgi:rubrerythrin
MFTCKVCGSAVEAGQAFCTTCGADVADNYECECPSCGTKNTAGNRYCAKCGNILGVLAKPVCVICGGKNLPGAKFCTSCGAPLPRNEETHDSLDVIEMRKTKMKLDLLVKERMKGIDKEINDKRAKMLDDKAKSMKEIEDYRTATNAELAKQARMLDAYREKVNEMGSEDVAKLRKITSSLKDLVGYYSDPYSEIDEDLIEGETYVCPSCGAINPLTVTACLHCGRSRARATLLLAKGKIKQSPPVRRKTKQIPVKEVNLDSPKTPTFAEFAGEEFEKAQTKTIEVEKPEENTHFAPAQPYPYAPYPQAPYPQAPYGAYPYPYPPAPQYAPQMFNNEKGEPYQMPPIVQPVAFVPYVTQEQPLMQYTPQDINPTVKPQK